ncbi:Thioredoxin-like superfamily [Arabidopsis thaliana x Arabidopsis arenosa]|uniref:Thioredoxin-like superfamily n=1 Tax=Arabidopsis thaliana x Arabidopsis arenosa TaxID=1240361 RepID=A0A8T2CGB0_9BRAS|nr:Thioredoxin-like superfamily [Arabidopsis thaliana x Arabidopsis arenosa]
MENKLRSEDEKRFLDDFFEIADGKNSETARQILKKSSFYNEETYWNLEDAMQLCYPQIPELTPEEDIQPMSSNDDVPPQSFGAMTEGIWGPDEGDFSPSASAPKRSLASLYRPPFHLMFHGSFEQAKATSASQNKWLLVNLQSTTEFTSHLLNRDTWADESVSQTIKNHFIFWQVDVDSAEGRKVCTYYKLDSITLVLVINPTTGQVMKKWFGMVTLEWYGMVPPKCCGMVQPEALLVFLYPFMDRGPREHFSSLAKKQPIRPLAASFDEYNMEETCDQSLLSTEEVLLLPTLPPLPEEPNRANFSANCGVGIDLPNGQRIMRYFLKTDTIQLLWSFCYSRLTKSERKKPLKLTRLIPGQSKTITLEYESNLTFEQSGVANSLVLATWE